MLSGGVNRAILKDDPEYTIHGFGNYFMLQIRDEIEDIIRDHGTVAVCVAAKPNKNHYDQRFIDMGFNLNDFTFVGRNEKPEWEQYDAIILLGGETKALHTWLTENQFDITQLKRCKFIAGDSAGAYVLGRYTLLDYEADGSKLKITDGFVPQLNILVAAHTNNHRYHQDALGMELQDWCKQNQVEYVGLQENEMRITTIAS